MTDNCTACEGRGWYGSGCSPQEQDCGLCLGTGKVRTDRQHLEHMAGDAWKTGSVSAKDRQAIRWALDCLDELEQDLAEAKAEPKGDAAAGKEAEELRSGIEQLMQNESCPLYTDSDGEIEAVPSPLLQDLLDSVDARDSLARLERNTAIAKAVEEVKAAPEPPFDGWAQLRYVADTPHVLRVFTSFDQKMLLWARAEIEALQARVHELENPPIGGVVIEGGVLVRMPKPAAEVRIPLDDVVDAPADCGCGHPLDDHTVHGCSLCACPVLG